MESAKVQWVHHTKHSCFWGFRKGPHTLCLSEWKAWGVFSIEKKRKIGFEKFLYYSPKLLQNLGNIYPSLYIAILSLEWLLTGLKPNCDLDLCCLGLNSDSTACQLDDSGLVIPHLSEAPLGRNVHRDIVKIK